MHHIATCACDSDSNGGMLRSIDGNIKRDQPNIADNCTQQFGPPTTHLCDKDSPNNDPTRTLTHFNLEMTERSASEETERPCNKRFAMWMR